MRAAWLTQDSIPTRTTVAISLPNNEQWRAQFLGALLLLTGAENWELFGDLTPEQMAAEWLDIFTNFTSGETTMIPVGAVMAFGGSVTPPEGFLFCDGTRYLKADYPELYAVIGEVYGGNGTTRFDVPDLRDRVIVGLGVTGDADVLGEKGGKKNHTLTISEIPAHTHIQDAHNHNQNSHNHGQSPHNHGQTPHAHTIFGAQIGLGGTDRRIVQATSSTNNTATELTEALNIANTALNVAATATNQTAVATNQNTGGDGAHNNMQPYLVLNYIIRYRP